MTIEQFSVRISLVLLTIAVGSECCRGQTSSTQRPLLLADSVKEFSGEQGKDGWHYGYWDKSIDTDGHYDQSLDFVLLRRYGNDNALSRHGGFTLGDAWFLEDGRYYTSLWATGGHANSKDKLGNYAGAEQWAVRRWKSDKFGLVTISGHVGKSMPWGANWRGECQAIIVVDGKIVLSTVMDNHGLDYAVAAKIDKGSVVDLLIGPNASIGVVTFTAEIRERPDVR